MKIIDPFVIGTFIENQFWSVSRQSDYHFLNLMGSGNAYFWDWMNSSLVQVIAWCSWASCQICKIAGCACAGNAGNVFPATTIKRSRHASRHVRDARAVMHAGIANQQFPLKSVAGKTFPAFPAHAQPAILRIWQEAHWSSSHSLNQWWLHVGFIYVNKFHWEAHVSSSTHLYFRLQ